MDSYENSNDPEEIDLEIIAVSENIAHNKKDSFKNIIRNHQRTKVYRNSVNCQINNQSKSYIKEEIIISDESDNCDNENSINLNVPKTRVAIIRQLKKQPIKKLNNRDESLTSITLNCPRCNKTKTVFSVTITSTCEDCNIGMLYICNKCKNGYESLPALYRHKKLQCSYDTGNKKRYCSGPLRSFIQRCARCGQVIKLMCTNHEKKCTKCNLIMMFECQVCTKAYSSYSGLYQHWKLQCQNKKKIYYCNGCNYKCTNEAILARHLSKNHETNYMPSLNCIKCGKAFENIEILKTHVQQCNVPKYECKFCSYKPKLILNLKKHLTTAHKDKIKPGEIDEIMREITSGKKRIRANTANQLQIESAKVYLLPEEKMKVCPSCNKSWPLESDETHCQDCNQRACYLCVRCNQRFTMPSSLARHIGRQHSAPAYECDQCHRAFSFRSDASEHRKLCGAEPRFACQICGFRSRYKHNLRTHVVNVHGDSCAAYTCRDCGLGHASAHELRRHREPAGGCVARAGRAGRTQKQQRRRRRKITPRERQREEAADEDQDPAAAAAVGLLMLPRSAVNYF